MITITKQDKGVLFTFENSNKYLYGDGSILVPFNSLTIIEDKSEMITFRKAASNDIFLSARYDTDLGYSTKDEAVEDLKSMLFDEAAAGGITPEEVEAMIDEATSGIPSSQVVEQLRTDVNAVSGSVSTKADASALTAHTADTTIHVTAQDKTNWNNKLDASAYTPTDLSNYYTKDEIDDAELATAHAINYLNDELNTKEEVIASALTELSESIEDKANVYYLDFWGIYNEEVEMTDELYNEILDAINNNYIFYSVVTQGVAEKELISSVISNNDDNDLSLHINYSTGYEALDIHRTDGRDGYEYSVNAESYGLSIDNYLDSGSTNPVENAVVTQALMDISGNTGGNNVIEITQAAYDALVSGDTVDPDALYIITDATPINLNGYVQTSAITTAITSSSTDNEIPSAKATYDAIDAAKAYYIDFATLTTQGITDNDWDAMLAAINAHRPIYAGMGNLYYSSECLKVNSNTVKLTASDDDYHYVYTFTKNGSNDYSFSYETRPYVTQADKNAWDAKVNGSGVTDIVSLTQAEYDMLVQHGDIDSSTLYIINNVVS